MSDEMSKRTPERREQDIEYLVSLPINELRKRQDIVGQQQQFAFTKLKLGKDTKKMERALDNLDAMYWDLFEAVDRKSFRKQQPRLEDQL